MHGTFVLINVVKLSKLLKNKIAIKVTQNKLK